MLSASSLISSLLSLANSIASNCALPILCFLEHERRDLFETHYLTTALTRSAGVMDKDTEHDIGARRERPWLYAWVCVENEREPAGARC